jgi:hypothetical protein
MTTGLPDIYLSPGRDSLQYVSTSITATSTSGEWNDNETLPRFYKACTSFFRPSGTQLHPLIFLLEHSEHVKVGCASRHVELRANQVIPPAEELEVVITASRTFNVESSNDEMILL